MSIGLLKLGNNYYGQAQDSKISKNNPTITFDILSSKKKLLMTTHSPKTLFFTTPISNDNPSDVTNVVVRHRI